jgi:hypothetical protein
MISFMNIGTDKIKQSGIGLFFCAIVPGNDCNQVRQVYILGILIDGIIEYNNQFECFAYRKKL